VAYNPEHYIANKERYAAKSLAWRLKNKERAKENRRRNYLLNKEANLQYSAEYSLKKKYNLTSVEYEKLLKGQNYVCAICSGTCSKKLAVDHDHITGQIRGLLCNNCNRGIGHLQDSPVILQSALNYLKPATSQERGGAVELKLNAS